MYVCMYNIKNKFFYIAVSASTGTVLYECGVNKCKNETAHKEYLKQDILIIQRFQQTIRAIETRTGIER